MLFNAVFHSTLDSFARWLTAGCFVTGTIPQIAGKEYLKFLVSEIRIKDNQAEITGSYSALAHAIEESKMNTLNRVPTFVPNWLTKADKSGNWFMKISVWYIEEIYILLCKSFNIGGFNEIKSKYIKIQSVIVIELP